MSSTTALVEPALALYAIADILGRYGTLIALIIGAIGWATSARDPQRLARFQGLALGGALGYILIISVDALYDVLRFILGDQFLPPGWPYGAVSGAGLSDLAQLATALSGVLHSLGLAVFITGITLRVFGTPGSSAGIGGRRATTIGLVLVGASIGGNLFTVFAAVLL